MNQESRIQIIPRRENEDFGRTRQCLNSIGSSRPDRNEDGGPAAGTSGGTRASNGCNRSWRAGALRVAADPVVVAVIIGLAVVAYQRLAY